MVLSAEMDSASIRLEHSNACAVMAMNLHLLEEVVLVRNLLLSNFYIYYKFKSYAKATRL